MGRRSKSRRLMRCPYCHHITFVSKESRYCYFCGEDLGLLINIPLRKRDIKRMLKEVK